jgi:hypothetical protein
MGAPVRGESLWAEANLARPPVDRMRYPMDVASPIHDSEVIQDRRERHAEVAGHLGRGEWPQVEENAVHGVLVPTEPRAVEGEGNETSDTLVDGKEVEKERDVPAGARHAG